MRRIISEHFKQDGSPKKKFKREAAIKVARLEYKNAYRCKFCGHWHVGGSWK